eukprot:TRINITY_DN70786_c1_g1_i1.p1 TRINITY_DN70786_c1_g1~~TRINITY_DN70786_c1_g1_i1.p1  ORF type:complete len:1010 (-),score=46.68 TRINITY_DN70786_c1_g1_i1:1429-4458(-)
MSLTAQFNSHPMNNNNNPLDYVYNCISYYCIHYISTVICMSHSVDLFQTINKVLKCNPMNQIKWVLPHVMAITHAAKTLVRSTNPQLQVDSVIGKTLAKSLLIYDSYRPKNLEMVKEYIDFVLRERSILPNFLEEAAIESIENEEPETPRKPDFDFLSPGKCPINMLSYLHWECEKRKDPRMQSYLCFDSLFECGNLYKAIAVSPTEYDLYLNTDTNSLNRTQWFYFAVNNTKRNVTVKFNIMNQTKYPYFYKEGMKPLVFSEKDNANIYAAWTCRVDNISVSKTAVQCQRAQEFYNVLLNDQETFEPPPTGTRPFCYVLSFTHTFKHDNDRVYFSYNKPYSFSRMNNFLKAIEKELLKDSSKHGFENSTESWILPEMLIESGNVFYKREILCYSLGNVPLYAIFITGNQLSNTNPLNKKKYVVITGRVHSSETPGSYKVQGIIKFLLSKDPVAEALRTEFIFLIVPMLNPDGVILGNNRCSLGGYDLNRCWGHPLPSKHPTVYSLKRKLQDLVAKGKQIFVYCDLHGHSKLLNSFVYACHKVSSGSFCSWTKVRLLPRILARKCHLLDYHQCSFKVEPDKVNTARVIVWKEFKVINSFTLESSMYAYTVGEEVVQFSEREYIRIGEALMNALHDYKALLGQMQLEMSETRDWLKPGRLVELTGTPAADLLKLEIQEDKEEEKKRERREKLKIKVQMTKIPSFQKVTEGKNTSTRPPAMPHKSRAASCVANALNNKTADTKTSMPFNKQTNANASLLVDSKDVQKFNSESWKDYFSEAELEEMATDTNTTAAGPAIVQSGRRPVDDKKYYTNISVIECDIKDESGTDTSNNCLPETKSASENKNFHLGPRRIRASFMEKKSMLVPQIFLYNSATKPNKRRQAIAAHPPGIKNSNRPVTSQIRAHNTSTKKRIPDTNENRSYKDSSAIRNKSKNLKRQKNQMIQMRLIARVVRLQISVHAFMARYSLIQSDRQTIHSSKVLPAAGTIQKNHLKRSLKPAQYLLHLELAVQ